jgi:hypothetical protein
MTGRTRTILTNTINPVIYAELSIAFGQIEEVSCLSIAQAPPDFFVGAHAAVAGWPILTRDVRRYRSYFPTVELISPASLPAGRLPRSSRTIEASNASADRRPECSSPMRVSTMRPSPSIR